VDFADQVLADLGTLLRGHGLQVPLLQKHLEALLADGAHQGGEFLVGRRQLLGRAAGLDGPQLWHAVQRAVADEDDPALEVEGELLLERPPGDEALLAVLGVRLPPQGRTQDAAGVLVGEEGLAVLQHMQHNSFLAFELRWKRPGRSPRPFVTSTAYAGGRPQLRSLRQV
jgi:hypothetical protein